MSLSLGEGHTPLEAAPGLAAWAGVDALLLKREDLNPTGSHKDRGAVRQVEACVAAGQRVAVISSSGNAALAAATYGARAGVTVVAVVSPLTPRGRVDELARAGARVVVTDKPINHALRLSRVRRWPDLRPSLSDAALTGFMTLGEELAAELDDGTAVFAYASSGTTFAGIGRVLVAADRRVHLHPVQAGLVNGFSAAFGRPGDGRRSRVGDLGVRHSPRADEVLDLVRASGGQAWWVDDAQVAAGEAALREAGLALATECAAALAGVRLAAGETEVHTACLLLTGRAAPGPAAPVGDALGVAHDFDAVRRAVEDLG